MNSKSGASSSSANEPPATSGKSAAEKVQRKKLGGDRCLANAGVVSSSAERKHRCHICREAGSAWAIVRGSAAISIALPRIPAIKPLKTVL